MSVELVLQQTPDAAALVVGRQRLALARAALTEREAAVARTRGEVKTFEDAYLRKVGVLYAELDGWDARIAEREVDLYDSESARRRALEARERARETAEAAFGGQAEVGEVEAPPNLKTLFREVVKRIHPDLAGDKAEQQYLTLLMVRANQAYARGDLETLQRLLDDQLEIHAPEGDELGRLMRQIRHAERDLVTLEREEEALLGSEIGLLFTQARTAAEQGRELLAELAEGMLQQIAEAERRFTLIDLQIGAHGR
jgi:hypothetical protein